MTPSPPPSENAGIRFGLLFFPHGGDSQPDKYRLVLEAARYADRHGFCSVWVPERHFGQLGCLYPNPAVLAAALARETRQIQLRAGSVVAPLHNPIRIAEEWALVDNLSNGRVGLSFASGWHPDDFVFAPEKYARRHEEMTRVIDVVQRLWRGEPIACTAGNGRAVEVRTYPTPVQKTLPIWLTAAGNPKTFIQAGARGFHILTHLFNQSFEELAERIALYRQARADHNHDPQQGIVAVQMQTFVGPNAAAAREQARGPFLDYLERSAGLLKAIAYSQGEEFELANMSTADREMFLNFAYERLLDRVLFGSPESCFDLVEKLRGIGVNEVACQIDFGVAIDLALDSLSHLVRLKEFADESIRTSGRTLLANAAAPAISQPDFSADTLEGIQSRCAASLTGAEFFKCLESSGIQFAGAATGIGMLWLNRSEALASLDLGNNDAATAEQSALIDLGGHILLATSIRKDALPEPAFYVAAGVDEFDSSRLQARPAWVHARVAETANASDLRGDIRFLDSIGQALATIRGLRLRRVSRTTRPDRWLANAHRFYDVRWEQLPVTKLPETQAPRSWVLFADRGGIGAALAELLRKRGEGCTLVFAGSGSGHDRYLSSSDPAAISRLLEDIGTTRHQPLAGVVHLWGLDADAENVSIEHLRLQQERGVKTAVWLIQALASSPAYKQARLWLGTRGSQPVGETTPLSVAQAPLWGLGRTISLEMPDHWGGLADLDPYVTPTNAAAQMLSLLDRRDGEDQIAFRQGRRFAPRLTRMREAPGSRRPWRMAPGGSYWLAGGTGGIGLELARWLVGLGARHLVLIGRTPLPDRGRWDEADPGSALALEIAAIRAMEAEGAIVRHAAIDIGVPGALEDLRRQLTQEGCPPVRGAILTAVHWSDRSLLELKNNDFDTVLHPKVYGGWALHQALREDSLDFFIVFSSAVTFLTAIGQGSYAAANAFLDTLAHRRRAEGKPILCLNSGPWSDIGLSATEFGQRLLTAQASHGIRPMTAAQGCEIIQLLLEHRIVQAGVIDIDWDQLVHTYSHARRSPLLADLARQECPNAPLLLARAGPVQPNSSVEYVEPRDEVERLTARVWRDVLHVAQVGAFDNFFTLGGHSIRAAIAANKLQEILGEKVHFVSLFDAQTVAEFAILLRKHYPAAIARVCGNPAVALAAAPRTKVDATGLERLRQAVSEWPICSQMPIEPEPKNPPMVFVLACPRSGSTLLRVMLAGHRRLFAPPELSLLSFETLRDRQQAFSGRNAYRIHGALRALREINGWTEQQAAEFMETCARAGWSTQRLYRFMQTGLGDRLLVDKTPHYAMDMAILRRAEQYFANPLYIHLLRHPYAMIRSWEEVRMDAVFTGAAASFEPRELGELTWLLSNQNITSFLSEVPANRKHPIRYEDLVNDPRGSAIRLCEFLHVEIDAEMLQPYKDGAPRMTDGRGHLGDPNFHKHQHIDPRPAERWRDTHRENFLSDMTRRLAASYGYEEPTVAVEMNAATAPELSREATVPELVDNLDSASESELDALLRNLLGSNR